MIKAPHRGLSICLKCYVILIFLLLSIPPYAKFPGDSSFIPENMDRLAKVKWPGGVV
jgi:hypothetical protein